jgi:hypothetical protein
MPGEDEFIAGLEKLLDKIPESRSLEEWRHLFRRAIYTVGMRILRGHPEIVVGPVKYVGGSRPPPHPSEFICLITGDCPPPPTVTVTGTPPGD